MATLIEIEQEYRAQGRAIQAKLREDKKNKSLPTWDKTTLNVMLREVRHTANVIRDYVKYREYANGN